KVQREDGSWPSNFGYRDEFSLVANSDGIATKTLTVQVKENVVGDANVRLRQGGSNLITRPAVIDKGVGEQPGEPEEPEEPKEPAPDPKLSLTYDAVLPNDRAFTIEVVAENLSPLQTVSGHSLSLFVYTTHLRSKVQREDGSWPTNF